MYLCTMYLDLMIIKPSPTHTQYAENETVNDYDVIEIGRPGVLLTAGKNCTRVFPGNLFCFSPEPISVWRRVASRCGLRCIISLSNDTNGHRFCQFKVQRQAKKLTYIVHSNNYNKYKSH